MGIRNKWSIAFGIAKSAYENGAQLLFTYMGEENKEKIEELVSELKGSVDFGFGSGLLITGLSLLVFGVTSFGSEKCDQTVSA